MPTGRGTSQEQPAALQISRGTPGSQAGITSGGPSSMIPRFWGM